MLEMNGISVSYGSRRVLSDVSFSLAPHQITVLLGRNGSGKSTLISCINQRISYTGKITLDGINLSGVSPRERAKRITILPQILPSVSISVRELVALGRSPYVDLGKRLSADDKACILKAMEDTKILPLADAPIASLSGGERQNAFLAMVLAQNTDIVVLDEPTTYMDIERRLRFREILEALKLRHGKTVLMVTHDISEAVRWADQIMILEDSRVVFQGAPDCCVASDVIERTFHVQKHLLWEQTEQKQFVLYE